MPTPPTFVADYEGPSWINGTTPKTTGTFDGALGDVLVALLADSQEHGNENYTFSSSPAETWTENAETTGTVAADEFMQSATTVLTAARTGMTVSAALTAGTAGVYGFTVAHFTGSDGVGNADRITGVGVANPAFAFTTSFDNSAIVYLIGDWAATDGTTRTHRTVNGFTPTAANGEEFLYFRDAAQHTVYGAHIVDAGVAGSKTIGISAPTGGDCLLIAVEVRGTGAPPPPPGPYAMLRPAVVAP